MQLLCVGGGLLHMLELPTALSTCIIVIGTCHVSYITHHAGLETVCEGSEGSQVDHPHGIYIYTNIFVALWVHLQ